MARSIFRSNFLARLSWPITFARWRTSIFKLISISCPIKISNTFMVIVKNQNQESQKQWQWLKDFTCTSMAYGCGLP